MKAWSDPTRKERPVGLVVLMEGADGIRSVDELAEWHDRGVRLIGLSWAGTRYAGGTGDPGPLTEEGRTLLKGMAERVFEGYPLNSSPVHGRVVKLDVISALVLCVVHRNISILEQIFIVVPVVWE
jgi:hypothetical protein